MATVSPAHEQRTVMHEVRWETLLALLADDDMQRGRLAYDEGTLELMSPSWNHENIKSFIGRMIESLCWELNIRIRSGGSTTLTRADLQKSAEPDECYYVRNTPKITDSGQLSLPDGPPPDLVIEVDLASSSQFRQSIYASLGIAESWRFANDRMAIFRLQASGQYAEVERSVVLPQFTAAELTRFLAMRETSDEAEVIREFRDWVRANFGAK